MAKRRAVLVTGGASGIGAEEVTQFARQGAKVAFCDIAREPSEALAARLADRRHAPLFLPCDLTDIAALQATLQETRRRLGPIAALINNAANDQRQSAAEVSEADWDQAMAVNLKHQFFAARAVREDMRALGGGAIVNFSSTAWMLGLPNLSVYSAAKAAIMGLTTSLAREYGPDRIRVNAIAPGAVITERQRRLWIGEADLAAILQRQCLAAPLLAEEIARMALFLAADDSRMITKQCFIVDAGIR